MTPARAGCAVALWLLPALACAHGWGGTNTPLYDGLLHLLLNPAFDLPVAGVALLASRGGRDGLALAQLVLAAGVIAGAAVVGAGYVWGGAVLVSRLLIIVAGLLVAAAVPLSRVAINAIVLLCGFLTGHELLSSEPPAGNPYWFSLGAVLGAMVLQGAVGALTLVMRAPWTVIAIRIAGSWIAAIGIIYAGFLFIPAR